MNNDAPTTVLIAVFATAVFVCLLYFCHAHLRPHLKKPKDRVASPIPQWESWQVRPNPQLRESLYALPAPNYLHPRQTETDNQMRRTRWSTNVYDLSQPSSKKFHHKHSRQFSLQCNLPPGPSLIDLRLPSSSQGSMTSQRTPNGTLKRNTMSDLASLSKKNRESKQTPKRNTLTMSDLLALSSDPTIPRTRNSLRHRSRSDSLVPTRRSMLAESHATLTGAKGVYDPRSPTTASLSEASLPLIGKRKSLSRYSSYASFAQAASDANSPGPSGPSSESGDTRKTRTSPPPLPPLPVQGA